jgi:hypothetical protein
MRSHQIRALQLLGSLTAVAATALGACSDCTTVKIDEPDRKVAGQLTYQAPGAAPAMGDIGTGSSFDVNTDPSATNPGMVHFTLVPAETLPGTTRPAFEARLVVDVSPGPTSQEIDLTDDDASLSVPPTGAAGTISYHGVTGHLSIRDLNYVCAPVCLLHAQGSLTVSATGPNGEAFALPAGTFVANDTIEDLGCQD